MTGSAHDAAAFASTAASRFPDWLFKGNEFAWADSAYTLTPRTIPVHKEPASLIPRNTLFDKALARIRVRSEHTMGALKGRWQCLRGLRVLINSKNDHVKACRWITIAMILHNIVIDIEGEEMAQHFAAQHDMSEEPREDDEAAEVEVLASVRSGDGEARRKLLIDEYVAYHEERTGVHVG